MSEKYFKARRNFIRLSTSVGTGLILTACPDGKRRDRNSEGDKDKAEENPDNEPAEVTANEDLMREHGVLRRALLIYTEVVPRLRADAGSVSSDALQKTAKLFRTFGEEYHEKQLEEAHIFPAVKAARGPASAYPDILTEQHQRGREITEYILTVAPGLRLGAAIAEPLARALESMVLMYRNHAACEDTIVFPAWKNWKNTMSAKQYEEVGDQFEDIEQKMFGHDGFEDAVRQIADIESTLGLADLKQFTPPPPPGYPKA
jgi:hemerythrin-like domain-containing protein